MKLARFFNPDRFAAHELVLAGFPITQSNPPPSRRESGIVVQVDFERQRLTLAPRLVSGEHVWRWNGRTRFTLGTRPASVCALKEGDRVRARGVKQNRERIAREIIILPG